MSENRVPVSQSNSRFINHRLMNFVSVVRSITRGEIPVPQNLRNLTIQSLRLFKTFQDDDGSYYCTCAKCNSSGRFEEDAPGVRLDIEGRGPICFACQGEGHFPLPSPDEYLKLLRQYKGLISRKHRGNISKVLDELNPLAESEVMYEDAKEGPKAFEAAIIPFWVDIAIDWTELMFSSSDSSSN